MKLAVATVLSLSVAAVLSACSPQTAADHSASSAAESAAVAMASEQAASTVAIDPSAFTGKWTGPEGTALTIAPQGSDYKVTVQNLDGPRDFIGQTADGGIQFARDGQTFVIRPGSGEETGMKWLADKDNCLIVGPGEGYCRD
jgi:uncharacterized protein (DUF2147 family)